MKLQRSLLINLLLSIFVAFLVYFASNAEFLERFELFTADICFRLKKPVPSHPSILVIEITDDDIAKIGRWPWKRSWHAAIAKVLTDLGAKAVYFDIIFSEPSNEQDDALFEEAMRVSRAVYIPYVFRGRPYNVNNSLLPVKRLADRAKGMGAMNVYPDSDGAIRKLPILFVGEGGTFPHVSLSIAMDYLDLGIGKITKGNLNLKRGERELNIPLLESNELVINWAGKWTESFKHYSFIEVLASYQDLLEGKESAIDLGAFKGAICLVGLTSYGLYDIKPVPLEPEYPGIGVIANTVNTILEGKFIFMPPRWLNIFLLFFLTMLPSLFIFGENPVRETLLTVLVAVAYFLFAFFMFTKGLDLDISFPLIGLFVNYVTVGTYNFVRLTVEKKSLFAVSITDSLTGLFNIGYFKVLLDAEIKMTRAGASPGFVLVMADIDNFKHFNDTYGHQVGDLVLQEVSRAIKASIRVADIVARYGGEEIVIILKSSMFRDGLEVTEKMRRNIAENRFSDGKNTYSVTVSFGVASYKPGDTVETIIKRADEGLYVSKESGRNCVCTVEKG